MCPLLYTNTTPTQVGRYERINNKLIPQLKEVLERGNLTIANASEFSSLSEDNQKVILEIINSNIQLNKDEAIKLKNQLKEIENEKAKEIKNNQTIIEENLKLKAELKKTTLKSDEEIKQLEGQLRVQLEKDIDDKYKLKLEEVKNEVKSSNEEKERLKTEIEQLKANAPADNLDEIKENYKLIPILKALNTNLIMLKKQYDSMQQNDINLSNCIIDDLRSINRAKGILDIFNKDLF